MFGMIGPAKSLGRKMRPLQTAWTWMNDSILLSSRRSKIKRRPFLGDVKMIGIFLVHFIFPPFFGFWQLKCFFDVFSFKWGTNKQIPRLAYGLSLWLLSLVSRSIACITVCIHICHMH